MEAGDVWRMCQVKDAPVKTGSVWLFRRARATGAAAVFWLDEARPHDAQLIAKVNRPSPSSTQTGLEFHILFARGGHSVWLGRDQGGARHHLGDRERAP